MACGSKQDHVNNFNGADGDIMYMYDSSTDCFGFQSSADLVAALIQQLDTGLLGDGHLGLRIEDVLHGDGEADLVAQLVNPIGILMALLHDVPLFGRR